MALRSVLISTNKVEQSPYGDVFWGQMQSTARDAVHRETDSYPYINKIILSQPSLAGGLACLLALELGDLCITSAALEASFLRILSDNPGLLESCICDLNAYAERDPACHGVVTAFLYFKGFLSVQAQRIAHLYWKAGDASFAYWLQNRVSTRAGVDIHPNARIGNGVFIDHATGIVVGETSVIGDNVSMLHGVTLGGTGKETGDRHPKIGDNVLISANATVLGNIRIGDGCRIGACSVVLADVPDNTTMVGNPARAVNTDEKTMSASDRTKSAQQTATYTAT